MTSDKLRFPTMKMVEVLRKLLNYWQLKLVEAQYIGGYVGTSNLARLVLCQSQEGQEKDKQNISLI